VSVFFELKNVSATLTSICSQVTTIRSDVSCVRANVAAILTQVAAFSTIEMRVLGHDTGRGKTDRSDKWQQYAQ